MKRCVGCGETKPFDAFSLDREKSDKCKSRCKACFSAYVRAKRKGLKKYCRKCSRIKLLSSFGTHKSHKDGHQSHCKDCMNEHYRTVWVPKRRREHANYAQLHTNQTTIDLDTPPEGSIKHSCGAVLLFGSDGDGLGVEWCPRCQNVMYTPRQVGTAPDSRIGRFLLKGETSRQREGVG